MDMAEFRSVKTSVKLTAMARDYCRCCYSAQNLEKLCSPALDVYLSICDYQGLENEDIHIETCLQCFEFLKEVHEFKMKCPAVDENFYKNRDFKYCEIELTPRNSINENSSQLDIKKEPIDEYEEIDQINIQINKVEVDSDHENKQAMLVTVPEYPLVSIKPNNDDQFHVSVHSDEGNLLIESYDIKQDHILECNNMIAQQASYSKRRSIIPIDECETVVKSAKHHTKFFECNECSYKSTFKRYLRDHITRKHRDEKPFSCNQCDHHYKLKKDLMHHKNRVHLEMAARKFVKCDKCSFETTHKSYLKNHVTRKHCDEKPFSCKRCDIHFKLKPDLIRHRLKVHLDTAAGKFVECNECSYKTTRKNNLKDHIGRKHSDKETYSCEHCYYCAKTKQDLSIHKEKYCKGPYKCEYCDYTALTVYRLRDHNRWRHSDDKPFSCDQCNYSCKAKKGLTVHKKVHLDKSEHPYKCTQCSYSSIYLRSIKSHFIRKHSPENKL